VVPFGRQNYFGAVVAGHPPPFKVVTIAVLLTAKNAFACRIACG